MDILEYNNNILLYIYISTVDFTFLHQQGYFPAILSITMESSSSSTPPAAVTDGTSPDPPGLHRVESIGIIDVGRTDEANLCILTHMKQPTTSTEDDFQTLVKRSSRTMIEPTSAAGGHEGPIVVERSDGLHRDLVKVSLNPQATGSELKDGITSQL